MRGCKRKDGRRRLKYTGCDVRPDTDGYLFFTGVEIMLSAILATANETANAAATHGDGGGNGFIVLMILGGLAWVLYAIFSPKKAKYRVEHETRVRPLK